MTGVLEIVIGLLLGYALASTAESVIHEYIADASPKIVAGWRRYPRLFGKLISTRYGHHVVHHQTYLTTHVRQFETPCQRARVTDFLLRRGRYGRILVASDFGLRLMPEGIFFNLLPLVPPAVALWLTLPATMSLPAMITFTLPSFFSHAVHPFLHMPFAQAQMVAPPLMAAFLRTAYGRAMYRNHFLHHHYGGVSNFNLLLGADVLRRKYRGADAGALRTMRDVGMPLD
jgi:hypothetical protein